MCRIKGDHAVGIFFRTNGRRDERTVVFSVCCLFRGNIPRVRDENEFFCGGLYARKHGVPATDSAHEIGRWIMAALPFEYRDRLSASGYLVDDAAQTPDAGENFIK